MKNDLSDLGLWPRASSAGFDLDETTNADALSAVWHHAIGNRPHAEYQKDPVGWARDKLGIPEHTLRWTLNPGYESHSWDGTADPMVAILEGIALGLNVGVESATTTGKTFLGAVLTLWWLACWENGIVITAAPKEDQLALHIWKEIGRLWPRFQVHFPNATRTHLKIRMRGALDPRDETWAATGFVAGVKREEVEGSASKAQGFHAEHMLILHEETPGIHIAIMRAFEATCRAPHNIRVAFGNPNHQLDNLHVFCQGPRTRHVVISAYDHPNVVTGRDNIVPGAVSRQGIADALAHAAHDGGAENAFFKSRVRGISPEQASNALIRLEWLRQARDRYLARQAKGEIPIKVTGRGVDAANSEAGDRACIVDFCDNVWRMPDAFPCPNSNALGRRVTKECRDMGLEATRVGIDNIGVGAGTVNTCWDERFMVQALNAGGPPLKMVEKAEDGKLHEWSPDVNRFQKLRSQMYWQAREDLRKGLVDGPEDQELWKELTIITFEDSDRVVKVEAKDTIKATLGHSPDKADAWVMANWVRKRAIILAEVEIADGVSLGWDYEKNLPRKKQTAEEIMASWMGTPSKNDPMHGRFDTPRPVFPGQTRDTTLRGGWPAMTPLTDL